MIFVVVFDLKHFNLTEFGSDSNQAMVLLNVINMNMQHIWIKFTFSIVEKLASCIFDENFECRVLGLFQTDLVYVKLGIIPTDN